MSRTRRLAIWAGVAAAIAGIYFLVDPSRSAWLPQCAFFRMTGLQCPGCGSQRMIHALLHGDIRGAWDYNAFLLLLIPLIILIALSEMAPRRCPRLFRAIHSPVMLILLCCAIVGWTIYRNFMT